MNTTAKILSAFAVGAASGILLGVLFAPDKGSETRKMIRKQGKKLASELEQKFQHEKERLSGLKDQVEKIAREKMEVFT